MRRITDELNRHSLDDSDGEVFSDEIADEAAIDDARWFLLQLLNPDHLLNLFRNEGADVERTKREVHC